MRKRTIALIAGGISSEREVSLLGAEQIFAALDKNKYHVRRYDPQSDLQRLVAEAPELDAAFINLHGPWGEDGTVQGLLDLLHVPYQGSGVLGSALAMNKLAAKQLYEKSGLPVPPYMAVTAPQEMDSQTIVQRLGLPVVVKPCEAGSSVGITIVETAASLPAALEEAFRHDQTVLLERYLKGVELTGGVIGNQKLEALPIIEIIPEGNHSFFDYQAKYTAGQTREICPARISDALTQKAQAFAQIAHRALFCRGYSRTDMILQENEIYVLETNTIPGMTATSLLPQAAAKAGMSFGRLLDRLIELALEDARRTAPEPAGS